MGYLEYAKGQGLDIHSITGVVIYPDSNGIPQDIILIPYEAKAEQSLDEIIHSAITNIEVNGIFNYFQNVRWTMPELEEELMGWSFERGQSIGTEYFNGDLRLSYGTITFDRSVADMIEDDDDVGEFKFIYRGKAFTIPVTEFPKNVGPAKLFKKINR